MDWAKRESRKTRQERLWNLVQLTLEIWQYTVIYFRRKSSFHGGTCGMSHDMVIHASMAAPAIFHLPLGAKWMNFDPIYVWCHSCIKHEWNIIHLDSEWHRSIQPLYQAVCDIYIHIYIYVLFFIRKRTRTCLNGSRVNANYGWIASGVGSWFQIHDPCKNS